MKQKKRDFKKKGKNNMQCNVIRNGDVLTAETFPELKKIPGKQCCDIRFPD